MYRLMTYFGVATLHFYRAPMATPGKTLGDWAARNTELLRIVREEALEYFQYELSHNQIGQIVACYTATPLVHGSVASAKLLTASAHRDIVRR